MKHAVKRIHFVVTGALPTKSFACGVGAGA